MARSSLKNIMKLIDAANEEVPIEQQFLNDLKASIEKKAINESRKPSQTYKPSSMNCTRQMVYQVLGKELDNASTTYQFQGICESGTDRHIRIQQAIETMKDTLGVECEYIDVEEFIKRRNIQNLEIVGKEGMETKLYQTALNMSFMCDGIIKYKNKYFIFEFKTETVDKFYRRTGVDDKHKNQAIAYSTAFGINSVMFLYENRNTLDKKVYLFEVTEEMQLEFVERIAYCDTFVSLNKIPPKEENLPKSVCSYCPYKSSCEME